METVFSLPYSEFCVASHLHDYFKTKDGFSIYIPMSRQEKGIDLLLIKRLDESTSCVTIQVKSSRTYSPKHNNFTDSKRFAYYTWFNTFEVPKVADYIFLVGLYPPEEGRSSKRAASWWSAVILIFSNSDMNEIISNTLTRTGKRDPMFGFGFNEPTEIIQTRGDMDRKFVDFSNHLFHNQVKNIKERLDNNKVP
jgi:hypothetical protein